VRTTICLFLSFFFSAAAIAQQQDPTYSTTDKGAIKNFVAANRNLDDRLYDAAVTQLLNAVAADNKFTEAYALLGDVYRLEKNNKQSIEAYRKVLTLNPDFNRAIYIRVGEIELNDGQYSEALQHLERYLTYPNISPQNLSFAKKTG